MKERSKTKGEGAEGVVVAVQGSLRVKRGERKLERESKRGLIYVIYNMFLKYRLKLIYKEAIFIYKSYFS